MAETAEVNLAESLTKRLRRLSLGPEHHQQHKSADHDNDKEAGLKIEVNMHSAHLPQISISSSSPNSAPVAGLSNHKLQSLFKQSTPTSSHHRYYYHVL